ncbi:hypothetical protein OAC03_03170 [Amylibacter sp.]|jgi:hypothetical protein|nr:hypothetical protein [Amylibacter sp.]|tara:strand:- start:9487 stop:10050 length:564 start_codon:yes stop_codon:yes gene_type:complete
MYQKIFPLLLLIIISACSFKPKEILINKNETCEPPKLFDPDNSKITLDGAFIFSDSELNYFYDIKINEWSCEKPKLNVVNLFDHRSTKRLFGNIRNNHIKKINEIQISMGVNSDFKLFVSMNCKAQGLSYLFEISSAENETIYGCQLTPNISSAVMWKQTIRKPLIDIAYINLYQPFIDKILEINSK